jgi:uncharacterized tellurite resistance protein B-like protein
MFVNELSHEEKVCLVRLFTFIARADGQIASQEWDFLNRFAQEHGLTYDIHDVMPLSIICASFTSLKSKVIAVQKMIDMAMSDGHYDDAERQQIVDIAELLSLPHEKLIEIESWCIEGQRWQERGVTILSA